MEINENRPGVKDAWGSGEVYEAYVGRWSRLFALEFLEWLKVPPGYRWLDVGCGTGALTEAILQVANPQAVKGIDAAQGFITHSRAKIRDGRTSFDVGDARDLPVDSGTYDVVVSGFALNFFQPPERAVAEMTRAARPGGIVAAYVWDYADRMQFMRHFWNAAIALRPEAADLDEGRRFPFCHPGPLADLFQSAGLSQVEVRPVDIWTVFKDFDDYWSPFLGGQGSAPSYAVSLSEDDRTRLRERIRAALPFALDGSIPLIARAWAVQAIH